MGGCISISCSADSFIIRGWDSIAGQADYIRKLEENLKALSVALGELKEQKADLSWKVDLAEKELLRPLNQVQGWLSRAEDMIVKADILIEYGPEEMKKLCLGNCFSKNCVSSYKYGSKVAKMLVQINDHKSKGSFQKVAETKPPSCVEVRPVELPTGQESVFDKVWSKIRDTGIIGLYGLGGVGKTTLLTQINNKFSTTPTAFDVVIWVVVSKDHNAEMLQEKIGAKIGFSGESWNNKAVDEKATDLYGVLENKKFVLLLDDLWERVDMTKVGIPKPSHKNGSKLIFTTRSLDVCGEMEAQEKIKVECLEQKQAWKLFQEKVGEETLKNSNIQVLAEEVVKQCGGLPLALVTIGRAMSCKTKPEDWKYAIEMLKRAAMPKMEKEVFPLLKFSYDCLKDETMKCCLLYCCLYPEDYRIPKYSLIEDWFGEGILNEFDRISEAQMQGHNIINSLLSACLLESDEEENCVKMHDVIRDMALWIACELEAEEDKFFVKAGVQLKEAPEVGKWENVRRVSLMENDISVLSEAPTSPNLQTLFLNNNRLEVINNCFFQFMPNLKVLNLSFNDYLSEFPEAISELVSLECLYLSRTRITELPIKMKHLTKLKILELKWMYCLKRIPRHLLSSFSKLQIFRLMYRPGVGHTSYPEEDNVLYGGNEGLIEELKCLQHLSKLSIDVKTGSALERFLSIHCFKRCSKEILQLRYFMESKVLNLLSVAKIEQHLERLDIFDCRSVEEIQVKSLERCLGDGRMIQTSPIPCFQTLERVLISGCDMLRDITWLILVPNLRYLWVWNCAKMEEIISKEKLISEVALHPFPNLEELRLLILPELRSIYWDALPFPCLKKIHVEEDCLKLKKLPLNSESAKGNQISIVGYREWWQNIEWEDEATRNAFLPSFRPRA